MKNNAEKHFPPIFDIDYYNKTDSAERNIQKNSLPSGWEWLTNKLFKWLKTNKSLNYSAERLILG